MNIKDNCMNRNEFLEKIKEILQYESEEELSLNTNLLDLEEWDSLSQISIIAFLDSDFNKKITYDDLKNFTKIQDIYDKAISS